MIGKIGRRVFALVQKQDSLAAVCFGKLEQQELASSWAQERVEMGMVVCLVWLDWHLVDYMIIERLLQDTALAMAWVLLR